MQYVPPFPAPFVPELLLALAPLLFLALLWTIVLKGFALWHAARNEQKWWFIALLVINTLGILEIIYLIWFRPTSSHYHPARKSDSSVADSSARA
jgi:methionyl-tRNA synthetase